MDVLRINGGHRFRLKYAPSDDIHQISKPEFLAFSPRGIRALKPRVLVSEGDTVELGQVIVEHKKDARIKFTSPASGKVHELRYGPRRVLEAIVIAVDDQKEQAVTGTGITADAIKSLAKNDVEKKLVDNGLWAYLKTFPGWGFAPLSNNGAENQDSRIIDAIHISLLKTENHWPKEGLAISRRMAELKAGITALAKLAPKLRIYVAKGDNLAVELAGFGQVIEVADKYPGENIGVQAYYAQKLEKNHCVIGADVELALDIGYLLLTGKKRTERLYVLAGDAAKKPAHYLGRLGQAVGEIVKDALSHTEDIRLIAGGLFTGESVRFQDFMGGTDTAIQAMTEDKKRIPLVFFRLGADRLSLARTWLGGFKNSELREATTSNNGEERACIQCGYCIDICPVNLLPNLIMKAAVTQEIEQMESLAIHDCVDCGLCTFVCPSKIELGADIDAGKRLIEKEG